MRSGALSETETSVQGVESGQRSVISGQLTKTNSTDDYADVTIENTKYQKEHHEYKRRHLQRRLHF
jgi:hypothetical protein